LFLDGPGNKKYIALFEICKEFAIVIIVQKNEYYFIQNLAKICMKIIKIFFGNKLLQKLEKKRENTIELLELILKNIIFQYYNNPKKCTFQTLFNFLQMSVAYNFPPKNLVNFIFWIIKRLIYVKVWEF